MNFYKKYNIPFKFETGIKPVASGYSATSSCNGSNRSTVYHIVLAEDVCIGRLKRKKGEYLCSQPTFIPYSEIENHKGDNRPPITCKRCLKMIEKYKK